MPEKLKIMETGGGWYIDEKGEKHQLNKKALQKGVKDGLYELVDNFDDVKAAASTSVDATPKEVLAESNVRAANEKNRVQPVPGKANQWGPFEDYTFIQTVYGEFGLPAGFTARLVVGEISKKDRQKARSVINMQPADTDIEPVYVVQEGDYLSRAARIAAMEENS